MHIARWHVGKLVILWSWGGIIVAFALTHFLAKPVTDSPVSHLVSLLVALVVLMSLSVITWIWLGDREPKSPRTYQVYVNRSPRNRRRPTPPNE
jgi:hypothetical protein